jgi:hypothetical protein
MSGSKIIKEFHGTKRAEVTENGENYVRKRFIILTLHIIILGQFNQNDKMGRVINTRETTNTYKILITESNRRVLLRG